MSARPAPGATPAAMPRGAVVAMVSVALFALVAAAAVRLSGVDVRAPDAPALEVRQLRFLDAPDGGVEVIDVVAGARIAVFDGENGFLRSTLRGLARERKRAGFDDGPPFELIGRADGRLTLRDPTTRRIVDLESFGPTNAAVFARLLHAAATRP